MAGVTLPTPDTAASDDDLAIRLPRQRRSWEVWTRILDAGLSLIEEGGYDVFTIAAVCERADVAPRAVYERVNSKEGLFLAVYEHGLSDVLRSQQVVFAHRHWARCGTEQLIRETVGALVTLFARHAGYLRAVVLVSSAHPEIYRRGSMSTRRLGDDFTALLIRVRADIAHTDPEAAIRVSFDMVFSALVMRVSHGPTFFGPAVDDDTFGRRLAEMIESYLLRPPTARP